MRTAKADAEGGRSPSHLTAPGSLAWTTPELADPHHQGDKPAKVRSMFGAIARSYDLNNRLHSLWRDQAWRRFAVGWAGVKPTDRVLDMACGTGDLTEALARAGAASVVGGDFTQGMLDQAEIKRRRLSVPLRERINYQLADAMALPFADASFDVISIAFGIRNVAEPGAALREFRRALRPGGRLIVLEFSRPRLAPVRWFNEVYCRRVMPRTATWISRDQSGAYRYLPASVEAFMSVGELSGTIAASGFKQVETRALTLGICTCYRGVAR
ncbi:MAG: ubiquinone/menaquinone biosynthesis methyltransferase [Phycisphaerales bacterium]|nr:ubiquinone/menaquinone biosynthesis methyltransferase [Phycisphaerales bacterium]